MSGDSKLWEEAYKNYPHKILKYNKKSEHKIHKQTVAEVSRDFYRWKKTPQFIKWRKKQFLKQGGLCWYCQDFLPATRINVEHKTARSRGGTNNKNNLVLSCSSCNKSKGSSKLTDNQKEKYNKQNKNLKGTYLKNKEYFNNLYGQYSDESLAEKYNQFKT